MSPAELLTKRDTLQREREMLLSAIPGAEAAERRKLRTRVALIEEDLLDIRDALHRARAQEEAKRAEEEARQREETRRGRDDADAEEEAALRALLAELAEAERTPELPSLTDLGKSYRREANRIRLRRQIVTEARAKTGKDKVMKEEELRLLNAMLRDTRDVAVVCERYYDRSHHRCERYSLSTTKAAFGRLIK